MVEELLLEQMHEWQLPFLELIPAIQRGGRGKFIGLCSEFWCRSTILELASLARRGGKLPRGDLDARANFFHFSAKAPFTKGSRRPSDISTSLSTSHCTLVTHSHRTGAVLKAAPQVIAKSRCTGDPVFENWHYRFWRVWQARLSVPWVALVVAKLSPVRAAPLGTVALSGAETILRNHTLQTTWFFVKKR